MKERGYFFHRQRDSKEELGAQCGLSQQFCNNFVGLYDVVITCNRSSNKNENETLLLYIDCLCYYHI